MKAASRVESLLAKVRSGRPAPGVVVTLDAPQTVEIMGKIGVDWILIDQEHTPQSASSVENLIRAAELSGVVPFVKMEWTDKLKARHALDLGALGVQFPFVNTVEQLAEMIDACRYAPVGSRGFCSLTRGNTFGYGDGPEFVEFSNTVPLIIPQIETEEAVQNLDDLLKFDCPIWGIGLADLALSLGLGVGPDGYPELMKVTKAIVQKVHAAGKFTMLPIPSPHKAPFKELAAMAKALGNDFPYVGETQALAYGLVALRDAFA
jgi:4-hydroxy-2-oxoheptanedioate aldolase